MPRLTPRANEIRASPTVSTPASPWTAARRNSPRTRGEKNAAVTLTAAATFASAVSSFAIYHLLRKNSRVHVGTIG